MSHNYKKQKDYQNRKSNPKFPKRNVLREVVLGLSEDDSINWEKRYCPMCSHREAGITGGLCAFCANDLYDPNN